MAIRAVILTGAKVLIQPASRDHYSRAARMVGLPALEALQLFELRQLMAARPFIARFDTLSCRSFPNPDWNIVVPRR
jgi:hypothetical protein